MRWLVRLFRRAALEQELDRELRFHVETRTEELIGTGLNAIEARRRALAEFGGVEPIKEEARDARGTRWVARRVARWCCTDPSEAVPRTAVAGMVVVRHVLHDTVKAVPDHTRALHGCLQPV